MEILPAIVLAAAAFMLLLQVVTRFKLKSLENTPAPEFTDVLGADAARFRCVMIYFYSDHCPPCRRVGPIIDQFQQQRNNIFKVNAAKNSELAWRFKIAGTPSVVVVEDGLIKHMLVGSVSAKKLQSILDSAPRETESAQGQTSTS